MRVCFLLLWLFLSDNQQDVAPDESNTDNGTARPTEDTPPQNGSGYPLVFRTMYPYEFLFCPFAASSA